MNNHQSFDSSSGHRDEEVKLARWLHYVLSTTEDTTDTLDTSDDPEVLLKNDYHPRFYQQLPDFIMALLQNDPLATVQYAPLLYHLAGCTICHSAYLELYDAMRYAVKTNEVHPAENFTIRPMLSIPAGTLVNLCQLLINQAEAMLQQARQEHTNNDALARSLLQLSMRVSTSIMQSTMRSRALKELVRVATLFDGPHAPGEQDPATRSYSSLIGAGGTSRHGKVVRRAETIVRSTGKSTEPPAIYLQSSALEGTITQHEDLLELHLHNLDQKLRGHSLLISVPLGSLLEPVLWRGGNPHSILTTDPVDKNGTVHVPLGQTSLRLNNQDERSLLEVIFLRLEVRPAS